MKNNKQFISLLTLVLALSGAAYASDEQASTDTQSQGAKKSKTDSEKAEKAAADQVVETSDAQATAQ